MATVTVETGSTPAGILALLLIDGVLGYDGLSPQSAQPAPGPTEPTEATVVDSEYSRRDSGTDREFTVRVTDEYEFDGQTCRSSNVRAEPTSCTVEQRAPGKTVEASVDPDEPETSFLAESPLVTGARRPLVTIPCCCSVDRQTGECHRARKEGAQRAVIGPRPSGAVPNRLYSGIDNRRTCHESRTRSATSTRGATS